MPSQENELTSTKKKNAEAHREVVIVNDDDEVESFSHSGLISLQSTGQVNCYNEAGLEISCAGTGQDGESHAGIRWDGLDPRFTVVYCGASGPCESQNGDCDTATRYV